MPAINPDAGTSNGPQQQQRTSFRPPWVKDGPEPLPMPAAPWTLARARQRGNSIGPEPQEPAFVKPNLKPIPRKNSTTTPNNVAENSSGPSGAAKNDPAPVRKTSKITIIPSRPSVDGEASKENGHDAGISSRTQPEAKPKSQAREIPIQITSTTKPKQEETKTKTANRQQEEPKKSVSKPEEPKKTAVKPEESKKTTVKSEEPRKTSISKPEEPKKTTVKPEEPRKTSVSRPEEAKKTTVKPEEPRKTSVGRPEEPKKPPIKPEEQRRTSIKNEQPTKQVRPPQPPAPPMPPPPPPPPPIGDKKPISAVMAEKIEALRSRPRKRPDWGALMKAVESGNKNLKHVQCNDRSSPLIPKTKVKDNFMYESEKPNVHNELLKEIQSGVKLKKVQTNDRSKPVLHGLRKFRRQMTIEEQIQKAEAEQVEAEPDELDDIDKVRDDLQSTKQMLALELRNKEAVERDNKKLLTRILNLEVELEKERINKQKTEEQSPQAKKEEDEQEKRKMRKELDEAQKTADEMETKYHDTVGQLEMARSDVEELQRKNQILEKKLQVSILNQERDGEQPLRKQPSSKKLAAAKASTADVKQALDQQPKQEDEESEYEEVTETETESSDEEEDAAVLQERRTARELKLLTTKLKSFKEKEEAARKERRALRDQLKKQQKILREEKKKYKQLQKEVDNVASMMKDDEEEDEEEVEEEESEESESDSESEESEEEESDGDLPPEAPVENLKANLSERAKRHENCLGALRKGNYLLKANIDRLKDDLFKQKEMSLALQEDLNSVLAELG